MAERTPQLENGYVRFATEWLEALIKAEYPGSVKDFVLVIARETWGWNETWRELSMPRIAELLGVSVSRAKQLRDDAFRYNLIEWQRGRGNGSGGTYRVQKDYLDWIPRHLTGKWNERVSGKDGLSGNDGISGNDVLPGGGNDGVAGDRQGRGSHLIDNLIDTSKTGREGETPAPPSGNARQKYPDYHMVLLNHPTLQDAVRARYTKKTQAEQNDITVEIAKALEDPGCDSYLSEQQVIGHLNSGDNLPTPGKPASWWIGNLVDAAKKAQSRASPPPGAPLPHGQHGSGVLTL